MYDSGFSVFFMGSVSILQFYNRHLVKHPRIRPQRPSHAGFRPGDHQPSGWRPSPKEGELPSHWARRLQGAAISSWGGFLRVRLPLPHGQPSRLEDLCHASPLIYPVTDEGTPIPFRWAAATPNTTVPYESPVASLEAPSGQPWLGWWRTSVGVLPFIWLPQLGDLSVLSVINSILLVCWTLRSLSISSGGQLFQYQTGCFSFQRQHDWC